jgi:protein-S-isoprenylcysteine O-methyltransferase Ste14
MIYGQNIHLKKKGVPIYSRGKKSTFTKYILYPSFIHVLILVIFQLIKPAFQILFSILPELLTNNLIESILVQITGLLFTAVSLAFMGLTLHSFKSSLRFGMDSNNLGKLKTCGVFSISRNPFFVSIELYFIGIVLLLPNPFFIIITLLTVIAIHFFILKEEKFLLKNYGNEYKIYTEKVNRYF